MYLELDRDLGRIIIPKEIQKVSLSPAKHFEALRVQPHLVFENKFVAFYEACNEEFEIQNTLILDPFVFENGGSEKGPKNCVITDGKFWQALYYLCGWKAGRYSENSPLAREWPVPALLTEISEQYKLITFSLSPKGYTVDCVTPDAGFFESDYFENCLLILK